eukprot:TRINITY_DN21537_c0_g1_i1.p1 TRINITY_DN21537_c0_g1~~TRINITY_DN21537_c0_g1_i1.p1  ORF type:complete len:376 (-),score=86.75 TRINITY_DN21537_c0_g1_i1:2-1129(-)
MVPQFAPHHAISSDNGSRCCRWSRCVQLVVFAAIAVRSVGAEAAEAAAVETQYMPQAARRNRDGAKVLPPGVSTHFKRPAVVVPHGPLGAKRPFVYNHVAKTGGTFVKNTLRGLFGENVTILEEWQGLRGLDGLLPREGPGRPFVLGAIRAPCDYYLSLWTFTSGGTRDRVVATAPELRKNLGQADGASFPPSPENVRRFQRWVRDLATPSLNLLTIRFWFSYFREGNPCQPRRGDICAGRRSKFESLRAEIEEDLSKVKNLKDVGDCWLRTEVLEEDLATCLQRYATEEGVALNQTRFDEVRRTREKNKSGRRGSCREFYDNDTRRFILDRDRLVLPLFGYGSCCADGDGDGDAESRGDVDEEAAGARRERREL